jgi:hypothetical protein
MFKLNVKDVCKCLYGLQNKQNNLKINAKKKSRISTRNKFQKSVNNLKMSK